jgi:hypothetical protein
MEKAPTWYGPDLVSAIRGSRVPQEIGSHAFGHVIAGDPGCSAQAFKSDLQACLAVASRQGLELKSFVYPRNSIGHLDVLSEAGFASYRSHTPDRFDGLSALAKRWALLVGRVRPLRSEGFHPEIEGDLVAIPQTYLFNPSSRTANRLGAEMWGRVVRGHLREAVRASSLFHMWFHSHNLAARPDRARRALEIVFKEARRNIDEGRLENLTMSSVAERVRTSAARHG